MPGIGCTLVAPIPPGAIRFIAGPCPVAAESRKLDPPSPKPPCAIVRWIGVDLGRFLRILERAGWRARQDKSFHGGPI